MNAIKVITQEKELELNEHKLFKFLLALALLIIFSLALLPIVSAAPAGPQITYISNSTASAVSASRGQDAKGTITVLTMSSVQQDYKWKAYVGNVTGLLALDDANAKSIFDWSLATITGEIYSTRASTVNWVNVSCVNDSVVTSEQSALGMAASDRDNIN